MAAIAVPMSRLRDVFARFLARFNETRRDSLLTPDSVLTTARQDDGAPTGGVREASLSERAVMLEATSCILAPQSRAPILWSRLIHQFLAGVDLPGQAFTSQDRYSDGQRWLMRSYGQRQRGMSAVAALPARGLSALEGS
ncbi:MAG: hypothetical protein FJY75_08660 [Candidatus Eisenbacteria bacterium]|uniref:Uncharacterized protein n=1 Tax=Eiseniibacteriota bacterium TaxID=2212470 RepID=A0A938BR48_UNCEI|nr:hypothetical protein [Candidatus Eisenbacteria bacterium]